LAGVQGVPGLRVDHPRPQHLNSGGGGRGGSGGTVQARLHHLGRGQGAQEEAVRRVVHLAVVGSHIAQAHHAGAVEEPPPAVGRHDGRAVHGPGIARAVGGSSRENRLGWSRRRPSRSQPRSGHEPGVVVHLEAVVASQQEGGVRLLLDEVAVRPAGVAVDVGRLAAAPSADHLLGQAVKAARGKIFGEISSAAEKVRPFSREKTFSLSGTQRGVEM